MEYVDCTVRFVDESTIEYEDDNERSATGRLEDDFLICKTVDRLSKWVQRAGDLCQKADLELLGIYLYRLIFHDDGDGAARPTPKSEFEATYTAFEKRLRKNPDTRLRLVLEFAEKAGKVTSIPWEFLYMPRDGHGMFLAGEQTKLILTRFAPRQTTDQEPTRLPLRILIAVAMPKELGQDKAHKKLIEQLETLQETSLGERLIELNVERRPTYKRLRQLLSDAESAPHVLHFIGHGEPDKIALFKEEQQIRDDADRTGDEDEADWVSSSRFRELLINIPPRLVFLHACHGASAAYHETLRGFTSTALELLDAGIPAVVGMQYEIDEEDAAIFAMTFYRSLANGRYVDEAAVDARSELGRFHCKDPWGERLFGTPLVYLQSRQRIIALPDSEHPVNGRGDATRLMAKQFCPYPDCSAKVAPEARRCPVCKLPIAWCPKGHPMMKSPGGSFCAFCDREYDEAASVAQTARAAPAPVVSVAGGAGGDFG